MSTLILTPILAATLFFFAQTNAQQLSSSSQAFVQQEVQEVKIESQSHQPTNYLIHPKWLQVIGLTGFVGLMWLALLHGNRPKTLSKDINYDFEQENYFG